VLDLDGNHRETQTDLAELHLTRGQYDDAIANLRSLAATAPVAERISVLERIGDRDRDKLSAPPRAMSIQRPRSGRGGFAVNAELLCVLCGLFIARRSR
jgi:hypothetical protein